MDFRAPTDAHAMRAIRPQKARRLFLLAVLAAAGSLGTVGLAGCGAEDDALTVTGRIADERIVVAVPDLSEPSAAAASTETPLWSRVSSAPVEPGDVVESGDVIAVLDDSLASSAIALAEARLAEAEARAERVDERSDEIAESREDVARQREDLEQTLSDLREQRDELRQQLEQARESAAQVPPGAELPREQDPRVIVAQLQEALAQVEEGIGQAEEGLEALDEAREDLEDAREALASAARAADAAVEGRRAAVRLAEARRGRATVRAPGGGVVLSAPHPGEVLAAGAPLAELRPEERTEVRTYLTASQAERVEPGDRAQVRIDSLPGRVFIGSVERIANDYAYVPTSFSTKEIHLLRGFEVSVRLDSEDRLPPGTPADIVIARR